MQGARCRVQGAGCRGVRGGFDDVGRVDADVETRHLFSQGYLAHKKHLQGYLAHDKHLQGYLAHQKHLQGYLSHKKYLHRGEFRARPATRVMGECPGLTHHPRRVAATHPPLIHNAGDG